MNKPLLISSVIGIAAIAMFWIVSSTISTVIVFIPGVIVTYVVYLNTFYKRTPDRERILPLYLFALGIQFLHFAEEYITDFHIKIPELLGQATYPKDYWLLFNMGAYFVFIVGGIILFKQMKSLMIIPLFFILVGVIFNSIVHVLTAIYVGGYFPGLYSALVYLILVPIFIKRIRMG